MLDKVLDLHTCKQNQLLQSSQLPKCNTQHTTVRRQTVHVHTLQLAHLPGPPKEAGVTSQSQANGTHDTGLARSIGTKHHIQSRRWTNSDIIKCSVLTEGLTNTAIKGVGCQFTKQ